MDHVLLTVLHNKELSETLDSLDSQGWGYVLYLYQYLAMQETIKKSWNDHMEAENKKK